MSKKKGIINFFRDFFGVNPKDVEGLNNSSYIYYRQELYLKIYSIFDFIDTPPTWDMDYLRDNLFKTGVLGSVETSLGNVLLICGFEGVNIYEKPTKINIANHVLGSFQRTIGIDGELLYFGYNNGHFLSLDSLVTRYAMLLANIDGSICTSLINSRVAHVFFANSSAQLATMQKVYDDVSSGKPAVFVNNNSLGNLEGSATFLNAKNSYIGNELLLTKRTIMNEFLTEIGVRNVNIFKKERLTSGESESGEQESQCLISYMLDTMNESLSRINHLTGHNTHVVFNQKVLGELQNELD